jgi:hypothetical protein
MRVAVEHVDRALPGRRGDDRPAVGEQVPDEVRGACGAVGRDRSRKTVLRVPRASSLILLGAGSERRRRDHELAIVERRAAMDLGRGRVLLAAGRTEQQERGVRGDHLDRGVGSGAVAEPDHPQAERLRRIASPRDRARAASPGATPRTPGPATARSPDRGGPGRTSRWSSVDRPRAAWRPCGSAPRAGATPSRRGASDRRPAAGRRAQREPLLLGREVELDVLADDDQARDHADRHVGRRRRVERRRSWRLPQAADGLGGAAFGWSIASPYATRKPKRRVCRQTGHTPFLPVHPANSLDVVP